MALSKVTIEKQPSETKLVSMSFDNKMVSGEAITSILDIEQRLYDPTGPDDATTDLTFAGQTYSGQIAQFLVSGGVIPTRDDIPYQKYKVTVKVQTDANQILENDGILNVKED